MEKRRSTLWKFRSLVTAQGILTGFLFFYFTFWGVELRLYDFLIIALWILLNGIITGGIAHTVLDMEEGRAGE